MKNKILKLSVLALMLGTCTAGASDNITSPMGGRDTKAIAEESERVGKMAADWLIAHPEIVEQALQKLDEKRREEMHLAQMKTVIEHQENLLSNPDTPATGPRNAGVAVVEFFDYQCIFCAQMARELKKVMADRQDVRYLFREWPIFASRWPVSALAAERGQAIWKTRGAEGYMTYHNALFSTGHQEGKLTEDDVEKASRQAGYVPERITSSQQDLEETEQLARTLGAGGTPLLIVMPQKGATPDRISLIQGFVTAEQIEEAIRKAEGKNDEQE
ncbi:TPA: thioredoxin domain-containing protein [Escherichia coli]|nr:thioredoxin domain-containing protein [Escherichia coli]